MAEVGGSIIGGGTCPADDAQEGDARAPQIARKRSGVERFGGGGAQQARQLAVFGHGEVGMLFQIVQCQAQPFFGRVLLRRAAGLPGCPHRFAKRIGPVQQRFVHAEVHATHLDAPCVAARALSVGFFTLLARAQCQCGCKRADAVQPDGMSLCQFVCQFVGNQLYQSLYFAFREGGFRPYAGRQLPGSGLLDVCKLRIDDAFARALQVGHLLHNIIAAHGVELVFVCGVKLFLFAGIV